MALHWFGFLDLFFWKKFLLTYCTLGGNELKLLFESGIFPVNILSSVVNPDLSNPDPAFRVNPGFWRPKVKKVPLLPYGIAGIFFFFFFFPKGHLGYRRSHQLSKENIQHFKNLDFLTVFYFSWPFLPSRDLRIQGPHWIRIHKSLHWFEDL